MLGLLLAAVGFIGLSQVTPLPLTIAAAVISGIGVGTFTGHVLPLLMNSVEREYQSRLQSVIVLCQSLALVVMNPVLGSLADVESIRITGVCLGIGVAVALIGLVALSRPVIRSARVA
jgi:MFS family permease